MDWNLDGLGDAGVSGGWARVRVFCPGCTATAALSRGACAPGQLVQAPRNPRTQRRGRCVQLHAVGAGPRVGSGLVVSDEFGATKESSGRPVL